MNIMGLYSNLSQGIRACYAAVPSNSGKFPMMKRILKHIFTYNYFDSKAKASNTLPLHTSHMFHHTVGFRALDFDMLAIIWQCAPFLIFTAMEWLRLALETHPLLETTTLNHTCLCHVATTSSSSPWRHEQSVTALKGLPGPKPVRHSGVEAAMHVM